MKAIQLLEGQPFQTTKGIVGYSSVGLILSAGKVILYDCGQRGSALQLVSALQEQGLTPSDITHVVVSHLHFDHVGNLPLFSEAEILMSRQEWIAANTEPDAWHCKQTCCYIRDKCRLTFVEEGTQLTDEVTVMSLPGHTKGLIGLKCRPAGTDEKPLIFCSDAVKNRYELWEDRPLMSIDPDASRTSIERLKKEAGYLCPGHDTKLEVKHPINRETFPVTICIANGSRREILLP